jgi:hypothetical protein
MATVEKNEPGAIPSDIRADMKEVMRQAAAGGVKDPELLRRVAGRSERVRQEILRKHGVLDVAVDLVRELREIGLQTLLLAVCS